MYYEVLIVEDESVIAQSTKKSLLDEGIHALVAPTGKRALELLDEIEFDLILMDYLLPDSNGMELTKIIRKKRNYIPIIFLTAIDEMDNKIEALEFGADDYLTKPFLFEELLARIKAIRRRIGNNLSEIEFSGVILDLINREINFSQNREKLTDKEFELLCYLVNYKGRIVSRDELCKNVWGYDFNPKTNFVEVTIRNLRKKLEKISQQKVIKTIYGEGFLISE